MDGIEDAFRKQRSGTAASLHPVATEHSGIRTGLTAALLQLSTDERSETEQLLNIGNGMQKEARVAGARRFNAWLTPSPPPNSSEAGQCQAERPRT